MFICICVNMYVCMHVKMYVCMHVKRETGREGEKVNEMDMHEYLRRIIHFSAWVCLDVSWHSIGVHSCARRKLNNVNCTGANQPDLKSARLLFSESLFHTIQSVLQFFAKTVSVYVSICVLLSVLSTCDCRRHEENIGRNYCSIRSVVSWRAVDGRQSYQNVCQQIVIPHFQHRKSPT